MFSVVPNYYDFLLYDLLSMKGLLVFEIMILLQAAGQRMRSVKSECKGKRDFSSSLFWCVREGGSSVDYRVKNRLALLLVSAR